MKNKIDYEWHKILNLDEEAIILSDMGTYKLSWKCGVLELAEIKDEDI